MHELIGAAGRRGRRHAAGHVRRRRRQPGRRPARARLRARSCRWCSSSSTPPSGSSSTRRPGCSTLAGERVRIDVFSIFPDVVDAFCSASLLGKARAAGLLDLRTHDLRDHTTDVHRTVDDSPFGGGAGMLMRPEPIFAAVEAADPPRPLLPARPGWPPLRPGAGRRAGRGRRVQPAVRALRGRRPPHPRAPRRRRAERRRRRARRRRGRRLPRRSRPSPGSCPA